MVSAKTTETKSHFEFTTALLMLRFGWANPEQKNTPYNLPWLLGVSPDSGNTHINGGRMLLQLDEHSPIAELSMQRTTEAGTKLVQETVSVRYLDASTSHPIPDSMTTHLPDADQMAHTAYKIAQLAQTQLTSIELKYPYAV